MSGTTCVVVYGKKNLDLEGTRILSGGAGPGPSSTTGSPDGGAEEDLENQKSKDSYEEGLEEPDEKLDHDDTINAKKEEDEIFQIVCGWLGDSRAILFEAIYLKNQAPAPGAPQGGAVGGNGRITPGGAKASGSSKDPAPPAPGGGDGSSSSDEEGGA